MSEFESMNSEQAEFEQSLKQLRPAEPELDIAELMFRAGRDSARRESQRQLRRWQLSTLATSVCAIFAVVSLWPASAFVPTNEGSIANHAEIEPTAPESETKPIVDQTPDPDQIRDQNAELAVDGNEREFKPQALGRPRVPVFEWWSRQSAVSVLIEESNLDLRNRLLRDGIEALPESTLTSGSSSEVPLTASPLRAREMLNDESWNQI